MPTTPPSRDRCARQWVRPVLDLKCISAARTTGTDPFFLKYKLGEGLGSGTTAIVRRGACLIDNREVAVKCIASDDEEVRQFARQEYELLSTLRHESIIRTEALFMSISSVRMVLELCPGGCLQSHVDTHGALQESDVRPLLKQLLEAVDYLHRRRVVHRDLKPENLLLCDSAKSLKITDFNSAKRIGDNATTSMMLTFRGTQHYCAPELLLNKQWNERVDVWASGFCMFYAVHGKLPFDCTQAGNKLALVEGRLPEINWRHTGTLLRNLAEQCLAIEMRDRPPAMELLHHQFLSAAAHSRSPTRKDRRPTWRAADAPAAPRDNGKVLRELQRNKLLRSVGTVHGDEGEYCEYGYGSPCQGAWCDEDSGTTENDFSMTWSHSRRPVSFDH